MLPFMPPESSPCEAKIKEILPNFTPDLPNLQNPQIEKIGCKRGEIIKEGANNGRSSETKKVISHEVKKVGKNFRKRKKRGCCRWLVSGGSTGRIDRSTSMDFHLNGFYRQIPKGLSNRYGPLLWKRVYLHPCQPLLYSRRFRLPFEPSPDYLSFWLDYLNSSIISISNWFDIYLSREMGNVDKNNGMNKSRKGSQTGNGQKCPEGSLDLNDGGETAISKPEQGRNTSVFRIPHTTHNDAIYGETTLFKPEDIRHKIEGNDAPSKFKAKLSREGFFYLRGCSSIENTYVFVEVKWSSAESLLILHCNPADWIDPSITLVVASVTSPLVRSQLKPTMKDMFFESEPSLCSNIPGQKGRESPLLKGDNYKYSRYVYFLFFIFICKISWYQTYLLYL